MEPFVGANLFHGVEIVAQLVVRPGLVDEVLTTVAGRRDLRTALATRHDMVTAGGNTSPAKYAVLVHSALQVYQKVIQGKCKLAAAEEAVRRDRACESPVSGGILRR